MSPQEKSRVTFDLLTQVFITAVFEGLAMWVDREYDLFPESGDMIVPAIGGVIGVLVWGILTKSFFLTLSKVFLTLFKGTQYILYVLIYLLLRIQYWACLIFSIYTSLACITTILSTRAPMFLLTNSSFSIIVLYVITFIFWGPASAFWARVLSELLSFLLSPIFFFIDFDEVVENSMADIYSDEYKRGYTRIQDLIRTVSLFVFYGLVYGLMKLLEGNPDVLMVFCVAYLTPHIVPYFIKGILEFLGYKLE